MPREVQILMGAKAYDHFLELYANDKIKAAKYYRLSNGGITKSVKVTLTSKNAMTLRREVHKLCINKNGILYRSKKTDRVLSINYRTGAIYEKNDRGTYRISSKNIYSRKDTIGSAFGMSYKKVLKIIHPGIVWMSDFDCCFGLSITAIKKHKLFSLEKAAKYKWPFIHKAFAVTQIVNQNMDVGQLNSLNWFLSHTSNPDYFFEVYPNAKYSREDYRKPNQSIPLTRFARHLNHDVSIFYDAIQMGYKLGYKVNLKWSRNRMILEHDKWAKEANDILMEGSKRKLEIAQVFKDLKLPDTIKLIESTGELAMEGKSMRHCVGSYAYNVESGKCAIYQVRVEGERHTLELQIRQGKIIVSQLKGYKNAPAPKSISDYVEVHLNAALLDDEFLEKYANGELGHNGKIELVTEDEQDGLPF